MAIITIITVMTAVMVGKSVASPKTVTLNDSEGSKILAIGTVRDGGVFRFLPVVGMTVMAVTTVP